MTEQTKEEIVDFEDVKIMATTLELLNAVKELVKGKGFIFEGDRSEFQWRKGGNYANTIFVMNIYHESAPTIKVGALGTDTYSKKYFIANQNITDGRSVYRHIGQYKESKHIKNVIRIAKKTLAPYSFDQMSQRSKDNFARNVQNIAFVKAQSVQQNTRIGFEELYMEYQNMIESGYKPKTQTFAKTLEYVKQNKEEIEKFYTYDPDHYFVWISNTGVAFKRKGQDEPKVVSCRTELPEEIQGKMAVLDITGTKEFIVDIGLKESESTYWVLT